MPRKSKAIKEIEDDVFKVSQSKVKTWLACKRRYHYRYIEKLRRVKKGRPLTFGTMVHDMIEAHTNGGDPFEILDKWELEQGKHFKAEAEIYGDLIADIGFIMEDYFAKWKTDKKDKLTYIEINGKKAEHAFAIPLEPKLLLTGKIDGFAKTPDKLKWLVEHKSFNRRPSEEFRWLNLQSSVYIRISEMIGWPEVDGTMWDYIHSRPSKLPEALKGGKVSQKKIDVLPAALRSFLSDNKIKVTAVPDLMKHAETTVRDNYFFRIRNPLTAKVVDAIYSDFIDAIHDMRDNHGKLKMRSIDKHCQWCDYAPLCKAEMLGHDVKFLIKREYVRDEKTHEDLVITEAVDG